MSTERHPLFIQFVMYLDGIGFCDPFFFYLSRASRSVIGWRHISGKVLFEFEDYAETYWYLRTHPLSSTSTFTWNGPMIHDKINGMKNELYWFMILFCSEQCCRHRRLDTFSMRRTNAMFCCHLFSTQNELRPHAYIYLYTEKEIGNGTVSTASPAGFCNLYFYCLFFGGGLPLFCLDDCNVS